MPIEFGSVPGTLTGLRSANVNPADNAEFTITWDDPSDATIIGYNFAILDMLDQSYADANALVAGQDTADFGVQIQSADLVADFGYQNGDLIRFKVQAYNDVGDSIWAYPQSDNMEATAFSMLIL